MPPRLKKTNKKKLRQGRPANVPFVPEKVKFQRTTRDILKGYKALDQLWSKGLKPKDLKLHFFMSWLARSNGNASVMAQMCGIHRNQVLLMFGELRGSRRTFKLRKTWEKLRVKYPKKDFFYRFLKFYVSSKGKPNLFLYQHTALVNLWLMGFPFKVLKAHYVLWAFRKGITKEEVSKRFCRDKRSLHRLRFEAANKKSKAYIWLRPLKPKYEEWYPHRKNW